METGQEPIRLDTLTGEISAWNRQEQQFGRLFSDAALKDREFLKMKLGEFDRLYFKYSNTQLTRDERALLTMLRFQRRKLERALYPGILRRVAHRIAARINAAMLAGKEAKNKNRVQLTDQLSNIHSVPIPVKDAQKQPATIRQLPQLRYKQKAMPRQKKHRRGAHM